MRRAVDGGARLVVLPEGLLSGYAKEQIRDRADLDWPVVLEELESTADLATSFRSGR
jgi:predicted amidohydrolase